MEKSADGPAAIFFCFKRLIRLCRRSWQFLPEETRPRGSLLRLILCNTLVRKEFPLLFSVPRDCRPSSTGTFYRHGETGENYFSREKERLKERESFRLPVSGYSIPFYRCFSNREIHVIYNFQFHRCVSPLYDLLRVIINIITNINGNPKQRSHSLFVFKRTCQR